MGLEDVNDELKDVFSKNNPAQKQSVTKLIMSYLDLRPEMAGKLYSGIKDDLKKNLDDGDVKVRECIATMFGKFGQRIGNDKILSDLSQINANKMGLIKKHLIYEETKPAKGKPLTVKTLVPETESKAKNLKSPRPGRGSILADKPEVQDNQDDLNEISINNRAMTRGAKKNADKFSAALMFQENHDATEDGLKRLDEFGFQDKEVKMISSANWKDKCQAIQTMFEILQTHMGLSEDAMVVLKGKMKEFKEINPKVNMEIFNAMVTLTDSSQVKLNKFYTEKNCSTILLLITERIADGKFSDGIIENMMNMCKVQGTKRALGNFIR